MQVPRISVVMPVYNAERYVAAAVESILSQTFTDFEFLVFDDGSTDGSLGVLEKFACADGRLQVFSQQHRGHVPWLNEGIRRAKGEFVARMDADDVSRPIRFERQLKYLQSNTDCVAVGCDLLVIDPEGDPVMTVCHDIDHDVIEAKLLQGEHGVISHPSVMMSRSALLAVGGYREEYEPVEDFDLWFRLAEVGKLANLQEVLFNYRQHGKNVVFTQTDRQKRLVDPIVAQARRRRSLPPLTHSVWNYEPPSAIQRHRIWAWQAAGSGYFCTAHKHAVIALRMAPFSPSSWLAWFACFVPRGLRKVVKQAMQWARSRQVKR